MQEVDSLIFQGTIKVTECTDAGRIVYSSGEDVEVARNVHGTGHRRIFLGTGLMGLVALIVLAGVFGSLATVDNNSVPIDTGTICKTRDMSYVHSLNQVWYLHVCQFHVPIITPHTSDSRVIVHLFVKINA